MSSLKSSTSLLPEGSSRELTVSSHCSEELEHHQSSSCNMNDSIDVALEELGCSSASEEIIVLAQSGLDCGKIVNVQEFQSHGNIPFTCSPSDLDETIISSEITICQEFSQFVSLDIKTCKGLTKSKTFPLPKDPLSMSCKANSPGISVQNQDVNGSSAYARTQSLPTCSTFVSAMKGSRRAQNGAAAEKLVELHVKWAPDVYDPPVSTVSHTVKAHQSQRPKSKKKKDKHKNKGNSSRGAGSERKQHGHRKTHSKMPEPLNVRFQANGSRQAVDGFDTCKVVDILECSIDSQEANCGSSFLREALPQVQNMKAVS